MWKLIAKNKNYSINENGEVRNNATGKTKAPFLNKENGYLTVDLYKDGQPTKYTVHRLLAEAFIENPEGKPCIDHKDGNRTNNKLSNLRWATYSENNSRFNTIGVRSERISVTHYPEKRKSRGGGHESWMNPDRVVYFDRIKDAANEFGVSIGNVSLMLKKGTIGQRGKMRGYQFKYESGHERVTTIPKGSTPKRVEVQGSVPDESGAKEIV